MTFDVSRKEDWFFVLVIAGLALFALSGCECGSGCEAESDKQLGRVEERIIAGPQSQGIFRFHDARYNVTCWLYKGYRAGGISCLPDAMIERK